MAILNSRLAWGADVLRQGSLDVCLFGQLVTQSGNDKLKNSSGCFVAEPPAEAEYEWGLD